MSSTFPIFRPYSTDYDDQPTIIISNPVSPSRTSVIRSRIRDLESELADLTKYGDDTFADGAVVKVRVKYKTHKTKATLILLKIGGCWYGTCAGNQIYRSTWDQVVEYLAKNTTGAARFSVAATWTRVDR